MSVTVKLSESDHAFLMKAAKVIWPGALLTRSSIMLGLAKLGAETGLQAKTALEGKKPK